MGKQCSIIKNERIWDRITKSLVERAPIWIICVKIVLTFFSLAEMVNAMHYIELNPEVQYGTHTVLVKALQEIYGTLREPTHRSSTHNVATDKFSLWKQNSQYSPLRWMFLECLSLIQLHFKLDLPVLFHSMYMYKVDASLILCKLHPFCKWNWSFPRNLSNPKMISHTYIRLQKAND